ncbi:hypothetical protein SAMN05216298_0873 [Glycomyces sambucus]|uniref:Uncharacterized protein n=1 Tax=Glycomyces sambucus TaxID=380244 RepID=A0A1G9DGC9_9ACTN|nr:hypothetical protein [Glycomyces sambucus]SDK62834.1 hypothetical protein SAMN05216298_0873 [Glycomyces sambucus]
MPGSDAARIADRPHWRDAAATAAGTALAVGAIVSADAGTSVGWPVAITVVTAALAWPGSRWRRLSTRPVVAEFDRGGVRLYRETSAGRHTRALRPAVDLPWSEIRGIYLWRKREGLFPVTMIGVEPIRSDPRRPDDDREGVPAHVSTSIARRSVACSGWSPARIEAVARRFTVRARVVDLRKPPSKRPRKVY